jgi:cephalosporin-C deacetylase-like acetyl esterase
MLLDRPGETVLREEIRDRLWPNGTVVEFDRSINAAVKRLRDSLLDSADKPRYIETLARRGYRFIGTVEATPREMTEASVGELTDTATPHNDSIRTFEGEAFSFDHGRPRAPLHLPRMLAPVLLGATILLVLAGAWSYRRHTMVRWARKVALPEATRLVGMRNYADAFPLIYRALQVLPGDSSLHRIQRESSQTVPIRTTPSGAMVYVKPYGAPDSDWIFIGRSPLEKFLLPRGYFRWRITKPGYRTLEAAAGINGPSIEFDLEPEGSTAPEMLHVPGGGSRFYSFQSVPLEEYWIDKYEVTNRQFKTFIDKGGYRNKDYWHEEFVRDGQMLTWDQAIELFRDTTGRAGPATWEVGDYPPGHGEYPVNGVSWYEAAAYAHFAAKQLPTVYHWYRAASPGIYSEVLLFSNFGGSGPSRVGSRPSLGAFGTYDMGGNVREWCSNSTGNRRYILGGSWNAGRSNYFTPDALSPFDRSPANGIRCVKYRAGPVPETLTRPVDKLERDHRTESPVSDKVFRILQSFYSYDHSELNAQREAVDESSAHWRAERITFDTAYDGQRVIAWLYLPRNAKPPYQTIVYFPAGHARAVGSIDEAEISRFAFLIKSGRAVLAPVYQGLYERRRTIRRGESGERDLMIQQHKDFRRSLDYVETRADIARDRLGFFGISAGSQMGLLILAQEPRIRAAVLAEGGLAAERRPPETDAVNFAPRVRIPVLMLNGRYDFVFPLETAQLPMFRLLGSREKEKRFVVFDSGHAGPTQQYFRETLDWFDLYLGGVNR